MWPETKDVPRIARLEAARLESYPTIVGSVICYVQNTFKTRGFEALPFEHVGKAGAEALVAALDSQLKSQSCSLSSKIDFKKVKI